LHHHHIDGLVVVCDRSTIGCSSSRKDGTSCARAFVLKDSYPGTIGSIVKWPDAAQTYLLVVDDPNGQFHVVNRVSGEVVEQRRPVGHQLGEFYNLHFIGIRQQRQRHIAEVQGNRACRSFGMSVGCDPVPCDQTAGRQE